MSVVSSKVATKGRELQDREFMFAASFIKVIAALIAVFVLIISKYAFIFFAAAMLPTLVSIFFDQHSHKCASATICTFNLIGLMPYLIKVWSAKDLIDTVAKGIIADLDTWIIVYGAAFVGQILYVSLPLVFVKFYKLLMNGHIAKLEAKKHDSAQKWNVKVSSGVRISDQNNDQAEVMDSNPRG